MMKGFQDKNMEMEKKVKVKNEFKADSSME